MDLEFCQNANDKRVSEQFEMSFIIRFEVAAMI